MRLYYVVIAHVGGSRGCSGFFGDGVLRATMSTVRLWVCLAQKALIKRVLAAVLVGNGSREKYECQGGEHVQINEIR